MVAKIGIPPKHPTETPAAATSAKAKQALPLKTPTGYPVAAYGAIDHANAAGLKADGEVSIPLSAQQIASVKNTRLTEQQLDRLFKAGDRLQAAADVLKTSPKDAVAMAAQVTANNEVADIINQASGSGAPGPGSTSDAAVSAQRFAAPSRTQKYPRYRQASHDHTLIIARYRRIW